MNGRSAIHRIYFIGHMINVHLDAGIYQYLYALYLCSKMFRAS